ncbi:MAG: Cof-type HAD-IIB family hydrolase [Aeromicrobium sp.]|uniref:Cof-type HAD-IIB family hydrolase n=1 Tax=Aeromicrobium sp. TaxID=1871063 RepID=UPI002638D8A7|nr:Cof-type HAD-IIB family hydrolase [Aeromicrobium sp.]MDF1706187.1 Cof-type HAD-IIB family hydrolase [Aeromicrobium sp.]
MTNTGRAGQPRGSGSPTAADLPEPVDLRLVVADMDGTLLDADGEIPDTLWPLMETMRDAGITFVPASGRQYATLARLFERVTDGMAFIAENGTYVVRDGQELDSVTLDRASVVAAVTELRALAARGRDLGVVVCGKRSAYVERTDAAFLAEVRRYYAALELVDDLLEVDDDVVKLAAFDVQDAATGAATALERFRPTHQVVVSGRHWTDVMAAGATKGRALQLLQDQLGVSAAQTVVFGDYLNDLEMLDAAEHSFAMANAHPEVLARARHTAPSNTDHGVITTLRALLGQESG